MSENSGYRTVRLNEIDPVRQQGRIHWLFDHCFEIEQIDENDHIPVVGSIFSDQLSIEIQLDFSSVQSLFGEMRNTADKINHAKLDQWLRSLAIPINEGLFSVLYAFTKIWEKWYPENPERSVARQRLYEEMGRTIRLSDILAENAAECAEIAAVAKYYLQMESVYSKYISGEVLWEKSCEFAEEHSFLLIATDRVSYIYDPTNPTATTQGNVPSIFTTMVDFAKETSKGRKRFVTAHNILDGKEAYFGVNNHTNIVVERDIV